MCTNKRFIWNGRHKILVSCGHCPACLQKRANRKARLIRTHQPNDSICLFVTLTYRNDSIPYVRLNDLNDVLRSNKWYIPVYRDTETRWVRSSVKKVGSYIMKRKVYNELTKLGSVHVPLSESPTDVRPHWYRDKCMYWYNRKPILRGKEPVYETYFDPFDYASIQNGREEQIGVIWHKDIQNFIKRLRINLNRRYHVSNKFDYFYTSEYGPTSMRPHFHLLLWFSRSSACYETLKRAIASSWSYDDYKRTYKFTEVAKSPSNYLASYVSSNSKLPLLFRTCKDFRPRSYHSQNFGFSSNDYSLEEILKLYNRRNFFVSSSILANVPLPFDTILFPEYVIRRFFPKIKGFTRLAPYEVLDVYQRPERLADYAYKLGYINNDLKKNRNLINRCYDRCKHLLYRYDWAIICSQIYVIYQSNLLKNNVLSASSPLAVFESYDNISDYDELENNSLDSYLELLPNIPNCDPNYFLSNVQEHAYLTEKYYNMDKSKKIKDSVYSNIHI